jgi:hypothetical protein
MKWSRRLRKFPCIDVYLSVALLLLLVFLGFDAWQSTGSLEAAVADVAAIAVLFGGMAAAPYMLRRLGAMADAGPVPSCPRSRRSMEIFLGNPCFFSRPYLVCIVITVFVFRDLRADASLVERRPSLKRLNSSTP